MTTDYYLVARRRSGWFRRWRLVGVYPSLDAAIAVGKSLPKQEYEVRQTLAAGGNM